MNNQASLRLLLLIFWAFPTAGFVGVRKQHWFRSLPTISKPQCFGRHLPLSRHENVLAPLAATSVPLANNATGSDESLKPIQPLRNVNDSTTKKIPNTTGPKSLLRTILRATARLAKILVEQIMSVVGGSIIVLFYVQFYVRFTLVQIAKILFRVLSFPFRLVGSMVHSISSRLKSEK